MSSRTSRERWPSRTWSATADPRLAMITTLPAAAALSALLAIAAGHDVDKPTWTDAYYETARSAT